MNGVGVVAEAGAGGTGAYSFVACLGHAAIDNASFSRWTTVRTINMRNGGRSSPVL